VSGSTASVNDSFSRRIDTALQDSELRSNFRGAMEFLRDKRQAMFPDLDTWEALRLEGEKIRAAALAQLPDLLEKLEAQCQLNGIQVHWAENAQQANEIIYKIISLRKATKIVKGKSMASEEIGLNHYLEAQGIECLESDMGEYIVQLGKETPSHIIMPAIHKTKQQIAQLFHQKIPGQTYTENVDKLIGIGRHVLRQKFFEADVGISGVNFAVAKTGTLCLVENEGNGRMSTSVPPVHIAICGIEKVIPKLDDLPVLLRLLTGSATGQSITTYLNLISSPRREGERDGPEEVHLVLLDNGRSRIYADSQLQQTLSCIRCGACMNHCPVYERIGGHAYGSVYPGPIGQVVSPQIWGLETIGAIASACSLNGACGEACPVRIPLPKLIRRLRSEANAPNETQASTFGAVRGHGQLRSRKEAFVWFLWSGLNRSPGLYDLTLKILARLGSLPAFFLGSWTSYRKAPVPQGKSFREQMRRREKK